MLLPLSHQAQAVKAGHVLRGLWQNKYFLVNSRVTSPWAGAELVQSKGIGVARGSHRKSPRKTLFREGYQVVGIGSHGNNTPCSPSVACLPARRWPRPAINQSDRNPTLQKPHFRPGACSGVWGLSAGTEGSTWH